MMGAVALALCLLTALPACRAAASDCDAKG
jgi:hypothetical protein